MRLFPMIRLLEGKSSEQGVVKYGAFLIYVGGELEGERKTASAAKNTVNALRKQGFDPTVKQHVWGPDGSHFNADVDLNTWKADVSRIPSKIVIRKEAPTPSARVEVPRSVGPGESARAIVVAWVVDEQEIAPGQKMWRHDLGERPKFVSVKNAKAVMWANSGSVEDLAKARAYAEKHHHGSGAAFEYPVSEKDPLGRAKKDILKQVGAR